MDSQGVIHIEGARTNNLKNVSVDIPRNKMVVITGVSGSGKSSLAFDTLYAEGQRRYVESLSAYTRQFLGRMQKPDVDTIDGIPPAIAIEQKVSSRNPRSTVGTVTEIYDYLKLLFARAGTTLSPVSGKEVKRHSVADVLNQLRALPNGTRVMLLAALNSERPLEALLSEGYSRLLHVHSDGSTDILRLSNSLSEDLQDDIQNVYLLVDRIVADGQQATENRFADSVQTAFFEGKGECVLRVELPNEPDDAKRIQMLHYSELFEADGIRFIEPTEHLFNFNNPLGACPTCNGFGNIIGIDVDLVVPDKSKSIYDDAIACWRGTKMSAWRDELIYSADKFDFPIHTPFYALTPEQKQLIWTGNEYFHGLNDFFHMLEKEQYQKIQYRVMLARFKGKTTCPDCHGMRLRKEAEYVWVGDKRITDVAAMPVSEVMEWIGELEQLQANGDAHLAGMSELLVEIRSRLQFMEDVGLSYLSLNRMASSLSGGESQRINLAKSLGSSLVGSLYVLDEPSIGLHARDTQRLIHVLHELRDLGNTIVVVEHDEDIMMAADYMIEIGPQAGTHGGEITYVGKPRLQDFPSVIPPQRRPWNNYIEIVGAAENNLQNLNVKFPLSVLTVITGVSGSGKSSLVSKVLYPALKKHYGGIAAEHTGDYGSLRGSMHLLRDVEFVDQNPLSKSSRSNPVTYMKAFDEIRRIFAEQQASKQMGFTPAHFSFNTPGGRCEECQGEGTITIEMQFMADIVIECEHCHGKRYKQEVLEVRFGGKNIYDILEMTVDEAIEFFGEYGCTKVVRLLKPLQDVGIGYVKLGQSSSTLSGGESQRVKLASYIAQENSQPTMFIFDEPTTGLHHQDVLVLLNALERLISKGHTVVVIEHNPTLIMAADHIIDLGPEGGSQGGRIVAEGTPEQIMACEQSYTGKALKDWL
ncbi:MAG: excinuclease ABC subunit UvrA [Paludibacteraceae bacterium]|nr:excinuclease ABC subunit UvrA [Paludibacteraceae bacterium]